MPRFARPRVPSPVRGRIRAIKTTVTTGLLGLFFLLPWVRWERRAGLPDQAVIVDIPVRRFFAFNLEFWPADLPLLLGLLIFSAAALFFFTTLFGRLWCGLSCPQTVWTDLFFGIDRVINQRFGKESGLAGPVRHGAYAIVAVATASTFTGYFHDITDLFPALLSGHAPGAAYGAVATLTFTTYALAAHARENVCLYMCPWPRFQSALLDSDSIVVTYQKWRGEPRARARVPLRAELQELAFMDVGSLEEMGQVEAGENRGDCIDCGRCVAVCPTRVDIRDGLQMGCIGCGLCVDACNTVMDRIERPRGLVHFGPEASGQQPLATGWRPRLLRVKPLLFALLMLISGGSVAFGVATSSNIDMSVEPQRQPPFVKLSDGSIRNDYAVRFAYRGAHVGAIRVGVVGLERATSEFAGKGEKAASLRLGVHRSVTDKLMITLSRGSAPKGRVPIALEVTDAETGARLTRIETYFWGPE